MQKPDPSKNSPDADLNFAQVDLSRLERCGRAEVIFSPGKTSGQIVKIAKVLLEKHGSFLATRASAEQAEFVKNQLPETEFSEASGILRQGRASNAFASSLRVGVISAGTADQRVAEEAGLTLDFYGWDVLRIQDVGVAGIHRLFARLEEIRSCDVLIVVAGMEGALPGVVGGLVSAPLIAVPTSICYGAGFQGLAALLGMLNNCASGITVVNIDNGFGAACAADSILRLAAG